MRDAKADLAICEVATKGPWKAEQACDFEGTPMPRWWISAKGLIDIAETSGEKKPEEEAANAKLMAMVREALPYWINRAVKAEAQLAELINEELNIAKVEKALDRAAKYVSEVVEGCPIALELGYEICKEDGCDNDAAVCWMKYFLSEEARRGGEGVQK